MKKSFFLVCVLGFFLEGCSWFIPNPPCPPPPSARPPVTSTYACVGPTVPPLIPDPCEELTLVDLVDVGLQNSPMTRLIWYQAKQAAGDVGIAMGAYLPTLSFQGSWLRERFPEVDSGLEFLTKQEYVKLTLTTSYLLFDFGGRNGKLCAALSALDGMNWAYNWEVQTVMIGVIQSYYDYVNALDLVAAYEATVVDNQQTLEASVAKRVTGAVGLSDELQARTNLLQSQINLEQARSNRNVAYATLAQAVGLPPDSPISVAPLPEQMDGEGVCHDMAAIIQVAKENRADLLALRSNILEKRSLIRVEASKFLPSLNTTSSYGPQMLNNTKFVDAYSVQFSLDYKLFNAFTDINELRKSQAALLEAQAHLDNEELKAYLEVLTDYYELVANTTILKYSYTYLKVAEKNQEVAFANYRVGITTIIDLMTANNALNLARIQLANAKANFLTALANLAYHTGGLRCSDITPKEVVVPSLIYTGEEEELWDETWDS